MSDLTDSWTIAKATEPASWSLLAIFAGLLVLAYPHRFHPWLAFIIVSIPTLGAFRTSRELFPDALIEENFLRFVLLYLVHISYLFLLSGKQNPVCKKPQSFIYG
jgi:hypothetical protein